MDITAVQNMNTVLATEEIDSFTKAYNVLVENGVYANATASKGCNYYWNSANNTIVLVEGTTTEAGYYNLASAVSSKVLLISMAVHSTTQ